MFKKMKIYTRLYKYALYWDWLMCNSCKCSCKLYKIPHILRHFVCGFRSRKVAPVD